MLFWISLVATFLKVKSEYCSNAQCAGPYGFELETFPEPVVSRTKYPLIVVEAAETEAVVAYRNKFTSYCYDGGSLDPNTGCYREFHNHPPSTDELLQWNTTGKCSIGTTCIRNDDCWGSWASRCFDKATSGNPVDSPKEYEKDLSPWMKFAQHTCVSSWRCGLSAMKLPVWPGDLGNRPYTFDLKGRIVNLNRNRPTTQVIDGDTTLYVSTPQLSITDVEGNCFQSNQKNTSLMNCNFPGKNGETVIMTLDQGSGCIGNICVALKKGVSARRAEVKAASIEDLRKLSELLQYENEQALYNANHLQMEIRDIKNLLVTLIKSHAKIDDNLIGKLTGGSFKTRWFNEHLFHMCPCYRIHMPENTNCHEGFLYNHGKITQTESTKDCVKIARTAVRNISLFKKTDLSYVELSEPNFQGTPENWDGWSFITEQRNKLIEATLFSSSLGGSGGTGTLQFLSQLTPGFATFWALLVSLNGIIGWAAFVLVICRR